MSLSLINFQMIRVISSPSNSTTGFATLILLAILLSVFTFKRITNLQEMGQKPVSFLYVCIPKLGGAQFALCDRHGEPSAAKVPAEKRTGGAFRRSKC